MLLSSSSSSLSWVDSLLEDDLFTEEECRRETICTLSLREERGLEADLDRDADDLDLDADLAREADDDLVVLDAEDHRQLERAGDTGN